MNDTVLRRTPDDWRRDGPSVVDDPDVPPAPLAPKLRRGRPKGSRGTTVTSGKQLSAFDFSFLRALLEGVEPRVAANLYLPEMKGQDLAEYRGDLIRRLQLTVLSSPANRDELERLLSIALLEQPVDATPLHAPHPPIAARPSLDEFMQRYDEDMYSEAELQELYREEFGDEPIAEIAAGVPDAPARYSITSRIEALHSLQALLVKQVNPRDPVSLWLDEKVASALVEHHVHTVSDLARWLNQTGRRWYERVSGIGRARAARVVAWLAANEAGTGVILSSTFRKFGAGVPVGPEPSQLVPLEQLVWPPALDGSNGRFRSAESNTLNARNDREAVFAWFGTLGERSQDTILAYRRAIERLALWALIEKGKALSSLDSGDIIEFKEFLRSPPARWCGDAPKMKSSSEWRPMRGPAGDQTIQLMLSAINKMFKDWTSARYLEADSVALVSTGSRREMKMDVMRSFSTQDLTCIAQTLERMNDSPRRRRLRAALLLLQTAGLRRAEAAGLTWGHIHRVRDGNADSDQWAIQFIGKGRRERIVPIQAYLVDALDAHYEDRRALIVSGKLSYYARVPKDETPLISVLDERLALDDPGTEGDAPHNAARSANRNGGLSKSRLYGVLKAFFREVARQHPTASADFLAASTHWLRHTYAHQVLIAAGGDLTVAQQLLGHADIATTAIYTKADMSNRVRAVNSIDPAV